MNIDIDDDAALIIFELISKLDDDTNVLSNLVDNAELKSLWMLQGELERRLPDLFEPKYKEILEKAKERIGAK